MWQRDIAIFFRRWLAIPDIARSATKGSKGITFRKQVLFSLWIVVVPVDRPPLKELLLKLLYYHCYSLGSHCFPSCCCSFHGAKLLPNMLAVSAIFAINCNAIVVSHTVQSCTNNYTYYYICFLSMKDSETMGTTTKHNLPKIATATTVVSCKKARGM